MWPYFHASCSMTRGCVGSGWKVRRQRVRWYWFHALSRHSLLQYDTWNMMMQGSIVYLMGQFNFGILWFASTMMKESELYKLLQSEFLKESDDSTMKLFMIDFMDMDTEFISYIIKNDKCGCRGLKQTQNHCGLDSRSYYFQGNQCIFTKIIRYITDKVLTSQ